MQIRSLAPFLLLLADCPTAIPRLSSSAHSNSLSARRRHLHDARHPQEAMHKDSPPLLEAFVNVTTLLPSVSTAPSSASASASGASATPVPSHSYQPSDSPEKAEVDDWPAPVSFGSGQSDFTTWVADVGLLVLGAICTATLAILLITRQHLHGETFCLLFTSILFLVGASIDISMTPDDDASFVSFLRRPYAKSVSADVTFALATWSLYIWLFLVVFKRECFRTTQITVPYGGIAHHSMLERAAVITRQLRYFSAATIFLIVSFELGWRVGFEDRLTPRGFLQKGSYVLQLLLYTLTLWPMMIYSALLWQAKGLASRMWARQLVLSLGFLIGATNAAVSCRILGFAESPLGRLFLVWQLVLYHVATVLAVYIQRPPHPSVSWEADSSIFGGPGASEAIEQHLPDGNVLQTPGRQSPRLPESSSVGQPHLTSDIDGPPDLSLIRPPPPSHPPTPNGVPSSVTCDSRSQTPITLSSVTDRRTDALRSSALHSVDLDHFTILPPTHLANANEVSTVAPYAGGTHQVSRGQMSPDVAIYSAHRRSSPTRGGGPGHRMTRSGESMSTVLSTTGLGQFREPPPPPAVFHLRTEVKRSGKSSIVFPQCRSSSASSASSTLGSIAEDIVSESRQSILHQPFRRSRLRLENFCASSDDEDGSESTRPVHKEPGDGDASVHESAEDAGTTGASREENSLSESERSRSLRRPLQRSQSPEPTMSTTTLGASSSSKDGGTVRGQKNIHFPAATTSTSAGESKEKVWFK